MGRRHSIWASYPITFRIHMIKSKERHIIALTLKETTISAYLEKDIF